MTYDEKGFFICDELYYELDIKIVCDKNILNMTEMYKLLHLLHCYIQKSLMFEVSPVIHK